MSQCVLYDIVFKLIISVVEVSDALISDQNMWAYYKRTEKIVFLWHSLKNGDVFFILSTNYINSSNNLNPTICVTFICTPYSIIMSCDQKKSCDQHSLSP